MPGVVGELREECPLGAAVALAEGAQGVDVGRSTSQRGDERVAAQASQPVCGSESAKHVPT